MTKGKMTEPNPLDAAKVAAGANVLEEAVAEKFVRGDDAGVKVPQVKKPQVKYVVANRITVSWGGQMLTLNPGDLVGESSYGPGCVEKLRSYGVKIDEVLI